MYEQYLLEVIISEFHREHAVFLKLEENINEVVVVRGVVMSSLT